MDAVIAREGLSQVSSESELSSFIEETIKANPKAVSEFLSGKKPAIMFLVGQVMKKTKGKANPKVVKDMLERFLEEVEK